MSLGDYLIPLAPEFIMLIGACAALIVGLTQTDDRRQFVSPFALLVVLAALVATVWLGSPTAETVSPPGLWLTSLTYFARLITLVIGALIVLVNWHQPVAEERGEYMAMLLLSLLGITLTASANDLIVLFFAIELVSVPTYVIIALSRTDSRASEAAVKYFFLGAMAAAILAYGMSFLYGAAGTTTLFSLTGGAVASLWQNGADLGPQAIIGLLLVFGGLAFKVAAVPFHVYAPDVYEGAASPVTGLLGFVPKFAGFLALIKVLSALNWELPTEVFWVLWLMAAATMTLGNALALLQTSAKRILAYSSIAHTGYMLVALLVGPVAGSGPMHDGVAALLFYMAVYGAMNLGAFALLSAFRSGDRDTETLDDLAGLARRAPMAALALAVCVFSLMGFPPTAGFLGKLYIFSSAFSLDAAHPYHGAMVALAIIGVLNSAVGAAYYLRIVAAAYVREEVQEAKPTGGMPLRWGLALCAIPMLVFFAWPSRLAGEARDATASVHQSIRADQGKVTAAEHGQADLASRDVIGSDTP